MDRTLQILLIIATILFTIFIIVKTSRKKLNYKLTLLWLCFGLFIIILAIFPQIIICVCLYTYMHSQNELCAINNNNKSSENNV